MVAVQRTRRNLVAVNYTEQAGEGEEEDEIGN